MVSGSGGTISAVLRLGIRGLSVPRIRLCCRPRLLHGTAHRDHAENGENDPCNYPFYNVFLLPISLYYGHRLMLLRIYLQRLKGKNHATLCVNCLSGSTSPPQTRQYSCRAQVTASLILGEFLLSPLILAEHDNLCFIRLRGMWLQATHRYP